MGVFYCEAAMNETVKNAKVSKTKVLATGLLLTATTVGFLAIVGYQIVMYLKTGSWHPLSVISFLKWLGSNWAYNPTNWVGLYKILDFIPLSMAVVITGWLMLLDSE